MRFVIHFMAADASTILHCQEYEAENFLHPEGQLFFNGITYQITASFASSTGREHHLYCYAIGSGTPLQPHTTAAPVANFSYSDNSTLRDSDIASGLCNWIAV